MPLTRSARFVGPVQLAACHLNAATPPGLFVSTTAEHAMLVHQDGDIRMAIALDGSLGHEFEVWALEPDARAWFGLALGAVELEIDTSTVTREDAGIGCIEMRGGQARLITRGRAPWEKVAAVLATTAGDDNEDGRSLTFTRWRLIQRDHLGGPVELFTHDVMSVAGQP